MMFFSRLFAFGFATPALLWGLALGAAPILIHLLNRRKFRETQWAAMRFLLDAVRKNSRRLRIEQLILLAIRTLIILLVTLALAQPVFEQLGTYFQPSQPVHRIIVIDASLSMGQTVRDVTLFERAKEIARQIVETGRQGEAFNLARLSNLPPTVIVPTPAYQSAKVIDEIQLMQLPQGRGDLLNCLLRVEELLLGAPELRQKEIYLLSDFQRATWTVDSTEGAARLKGLLRKFDESGRLILIDLGQPEAANLAITNIESLIPIVTTTRAARFRVTVHNYGLERVTGRSLEFLVDDRPVEQRSLDVNPGAETTEVFQHLFPGGGEHRVRVGLPKDTLPLDDERFLAVPVKERLRVLCVNGHSGTKGGGRATDFLELALAPFSQSSTSPAARRGQFEPVVVSEGELQGIDLVPYDCIFLCDVRMFTERELRILEDYLRGGGGVVWCMGSEVEPERYNQLLYRDGKGILPARLGERRGDPDQKNEAFTFDSADFAHPILAPYQGNPNAGLESTQTYAYLQTSVPDDSTARTVLRFDTGDPAIIESAVGAGRSLLVTTTVDDRWGAWPLWPSFVPLIHEIVDYAVAGRLEEKQHLVGEPLSALFPSTAGNVDVAVHRPDGPIVPAHVTPGSQFSRFEFDETSTAGIYEVTMAHPLSRTELSAVNVDPRESNLAKYTSEELAQELLPGTEFDYLTSWQGLTARDSETPVAQRGGLTRWLIYAAIYFLFIEQALAWDFRKGLLVLCPVLLPLVLLRHPRGNHSR